MLISMKRLRNFDDGNKNAKYVWLLVIACFVMPICNGQSKIGINDYTTATWNTNGARWKFVTNELSIPMIINNSGVEVLAVQEAGKLTTDLTPRAPLPTSSVDIALINGTVLSKINMGIDEYNFRAGIHDVFVYKFDRITYNKALKVPPKPQNPKQNLVIVSRYRADKVILLQQIWKEPKPGKPSRENINRPALGIVIEKTVFFCLHPEPINKQNEAPPLINALQKYMDRHHSDKSWIAMADFNRTPADLEKYIDIAPKDKFRQLIYSGEKTRTRELDYAVVGGPESYFRSPGGIITVPKATLLLPSEKNPSDHKPVEFKS